jgi:nitroimidazol reductase NimA-like FMN-containing flavoprotein (pyridoxamine 5'-phosphate oxidase superfamily)
MEEGSQDGGSGRRRLTVAEREALLREPLVGVLSTLAEGGWIHSVPVHFLFAQGCVRLVTERDSIKNANVGSSGRATLCVEVATPRERRYVSVEGPVSVEEVLNADLLALDARYSRSDASEWSDADRTGEVTLVIVPERWIAWTDWDED